MFESSMEYFQEIGREKNPPKICHTDWKKKSDWKIPDDKVHNSRLTEWQFFISWRPNYGTPEILITSRHYGIEVLKGDPQMGV